MTNNDILRRLRYSLDISDTDVAKIFARAGDELSPGQVYSWLRREDHDDYKELPDTLLCRFLDGLIIEKRGLREGGAIPEPLKYLSNNEILKKLRIAFELRDGDMIKVFQLADFVVTKAELGAFSRKEGQRNYSPCPEHVLRKFLQGLGKRG